MAEVTPVPTADAFGSVATAAPLEVAQVPASSAAIVEADEAPTGMAEDSVPTPVSTASPTPDLPTAAPAAPAAANLAEYIIQPGDELLAIAKKYQVSMEDILALNQIDNPDSLRVGQVLRIPTQ